VNVTFTPQIKVKDLVVTRWETDAAFAQFISRFIAGWDLKDAYTGEPLPLPEAGTAEWFSELTFPEQLELMRQWGEFRSDMFKNPPPLRGANSPATP